MSRKPVIIADGLTRRFGDLVAVDKLNLEVFPGEVFGFLGHNGAGKTTTIRLLNGVLAPSSGMACVFDLDPMDDGPAVRRQTGILTETPSLDERLTGRENLEIYADLYGVPPAEVSDRVGHLLETFELAQRADERAGDYSKGMKQRLALARALLHRPPLLFLDEPSAGLDPLAARRVHEMITRLSHEERRTVFLCTHNLAEAQKLCDRVAVLEHGRLVALGTPADLARQWGRSQRLQIEIDPAGLPAALEVLRTSLGINDPAQENGSLVISGASREAVPGLVAALVAAGVQIYRVAPQETSLEDVYFALHDAATEAGTSGPGDGPPEHGSLQDDGETIS
jgi:ABC-2 type transport system ATP-binding protein